MYMSNGLLPVFSSEENHKVNLLSSGKAEHVYRIGLKGSIRV